MNSDIAPQYECESCGMKYYNPLTLAIHKKNHHDGPEVPVNGIYVISGELYGGTYHKEKPMSTLKTMSTDTLSAAKKQRDKMRNQARMDVAKFASKFGCSEFEAAHAIFDTVLDTINDTTKNYGTPAMPNSLAQTLLNDTKVLLGDAEPAKITAMEMTAFNLDEHLAKNPATTTKKIAQKAATKAKSEVAKLDIYVSEEDLTGTFLYENLKGHKEQGVSLKGYNEGTLGNLYHFVKGKLYTYPSTIQNDPTLKPYAESLNQGYNYPIFIMKKSAPYVSTAVLNKFQLQAPTGYKWRKLKNKNIYKLIKDPKQAYYWTQKEKDAEAAKVVASYVPFLKQEYYWTQKEKDAEAAKVAVSYVPFLKQVEKAVESPKPEKFDFDTTLGGSSTICGVGPTGLMFSFGLNLTYAKECAQYTLPAGYKWESQADGSVKIVESKPVVSTMLTAFNTKAGCYDTLWSNVNYPGHFVKTYELPDNYSWNLNLLLDVAKVHPNQPEVENG